MLLNLYLQACLPLSPNTEPLFLFSLSLSPSAQDHFRTRVPDSRGMASSWLPGRMRWRTGDTCLSAASCVPCSPPLAFFRELRGTVSGIHQYPGPETVLRVPGATMTQHPIKQKKPPHLHDLPKRKSCSVRRFFA